MLTLLSMIWRGIAIGVMISAPMGPVGILCIQRTLNRGRRTGFYTGVGAAMSDLLYCLITGFGLSFIEEFLERNQNVIQLVGSLVLIIFGIYIFKNNPSKSLRRPDKMPEASVKKDILGGFLFTFSNPLILFLIIGLFARFNFLLPEIKFYHYMFGFMAILGGALGWWWVVTFFVNKLRGHFNVRSMWLVNKVIGCIIMAFAVVGIITSILAMSAPASAHPAPPTHAKYITVTEQWQPRVYTNTGAAILVVTDTITHSPCGDLEFTIHVADNHSSLNRQYTYTDSQNITHKTTAPGWAFRLSSPDGSSHITIRSVPWKADALFGYSFNENILNIITISSPESLITDTLRTPMHRRRAINLNRRGSGWNMTDKTGKVIWSRDAPPFEVGLKQIIIPPGANINVGNTALRYRPEWFKELYTEWCANTDSLCNDLRRSPSLYEGIYTLLDREMDENLIAPAATYRIAVRECGGKDGYDIIYLSGLDGQHTQWIPGMLKGVLTPSPQRGRYSLIWYDYHSVPMGADLYASMDGQYLTLYFPHQQSSMRFIKAGVATP